MVDCPYASFLYCIIFQVREKVDFEKKKKLLRRSCVKMNKKYNEEEEEFFLCWKIKVVEGESKFYYVVIAQLFSHI